MCRPGWCVGWLGCGGVLVALDGAYWHMCCVATNFTAVVVAEDSRLFELHAMVPGGRKSLWPHTSCPAEHNVLEHALVKNCSAVLSCLPWSQIALWSTRYGSLRTTSTCLLLGKVSDHVLLRAAKHNVLGHSLVKKMAPASPNPSFLSSTTTYRLVGKASSHVYPRAARHNASVPPLVAASTAYNPPRPSPHHADVPLANKGSYQANPALRKRCFEAGLGHRWHRPALAPSACAPPQHGGRSEKLPATYPPCCKLQYFCASIGRS